MDVVSDHPSEQLTLEANVLPNDRLTEALVGWLVNDKSNKQGDNEQALAELAEILEACGAWILTQSGGSPHIHVHSSCLQEGETYQFEPSADVDGDWIARLCGSLLPDEKKDISIRPAGDLEHSGTPISHLLHLPLLAKEDNVASLVFAFDHQPEFLPIHHNLLKLISTTYASKLRTGSGRQPREILTLQANLTGLIAKVIDPATDLNHLLSLMLEHTVLPLGAALGGIWLMDSKGDELELSSSLQRLSRKKLPEKLMLGEGLVGSVAATCQLLLTESPQKHPGFDPQLDSPWSDSGTVLMAPLCRHSTHFGVLCLCWDDGDAVSDEELVILENMVDLVSAFMANITLIDQLSGYSTQQQALLEMSRQIAMGLDLETTIARGLQWVTRLVGVEFGLLWLIDKSQETIHLQASMGSGMKDVESLDLPLANPAYAHWGALQEPEIISNSHENSPFWLDYEEQFGIQARDLLALPLESQGELIGVLLLINRVGGLTLESKPAMLTTAADMIALAVSNARMHSKTLDLIEERERAHALALQATRLATVGRLTATLSHEINNPMQAIRGALTLAQEDLNDTDSLQDYLSMCVQESDRVVDLIDKMRHVYLPKSDESGPVYLNETLQTVLVFAQKVSIRQGVEIQQDLAPELPPIDVASDQIHLVLLSLILNLSDAVAAGGGDLIQLRTGAVNGHVRVEFVAHGDSGSVAALLDQPQAQPLTESAISLAFSQDIIRTLNGDLKFASEGEEVVVSLELPILAEQAAQSEVL